MKSCRLSVWFNGSGNSTLSSIFSFWKYLNCSVLARLKKYVLVILFWQVCDLKMALPEMLQGQTCAVAFQRLCYCLHPWNGLLNSLRILIKLMNDSPKPNLFNVENRNFQLTLSNTFSASRVTRWLLLFELKNNTLSWIVWVYWWMLVYL